MKKYTVKMPLVGYVSMDVEAESESDAQDMFFNKLPSIEMPTPEGVNELVFELMPHIVKGNVCYAECSDVEVTESDNP